MSRAVQRVMKRFGVFVLAFVLAVAMVPALPLGTTDAFAATSGEVAGLADQNIGLSFNGNGDDAWNASGSTMATARG